MNINKIKNIKYFICIKLSKNYIFKKKVKILFSFLDLEN